MADNDNGDMPEVANGDEQDVAAGDAQDVAHDSDSHEVEGHPRGTMLLMLLFLILIVAMWGYMYVILIGRG